MGGGEMSITASVAATVGPFHRKRRLLCTSAKQLSDRNFFVELRLILQILFGWCTTNTHTLHPQEENKWEKLHLIFFLVERLSCLVLENWGRHTAALSPIHHLCTHHTSSKAGTTYPPPYHQLSHFSNKHRISIY